MYLTRRQRQILDYLQSYIARRGYAPSLEEIAQRFKLASPATVHKHLVNLEAKGAIRRVWNRKRAIEICDGIELDVAEGFARAIELPLLGRIAAGLPIEPVIEQETVDVPESFVGRGETYVLAVRGDSMQDEGILDGDYIIVERRRAARDGEIVVALLDGERATLKKYFRQGRYIRLQPANDRIPPIIVEEGDLMIQGVVIGLLRKFR